MAQLTPMYQALRGKQNSSSNPRLAPIAALFEDCRQSFERLCVTARRFSDSGNSTLVEDNYGKFLAWGNDSGASTRSLDHTLRKTSTLSTMTQELLKKLYIKLDQGIERIQDTAETINELADEDLAQLSGSPASSTDAFHSLEEEISKDKKVTFILEYIEGLVGCLMKLAPNLCDPFPLDTYSIDAKSNDADGDIHLAKALFPTATRELLQRLGWANWRRRKYLQALQEKRRGGSFGGMTTRDLRRAKKSPMRDVAVDAFNFQKPGQDEDKPELVSRPRFRPKASSYFAPSEVGGSVMESIFSRPITEGPGSTAGGTSIMEPDPEVIFKPQTVPEPPISLETGRRFLCPYCHDELDVGISVTTKDDWDVHVFGDLEPYMCTFDDCLRAEKTFGIRDDWFRHELESHRILKVWVCHSCVQEFGSAQAFKDHLQKKHNNISGPSQMAMMMALCVKHSEMHFKEDICPLCALKLTVEQLRDHIANHLEQLALTSINGDESSEEDDNDDIQSQRFDDNESVGRTKMEILNDFVEDQMGYVLPDRKAVADTNVDASVLDFVQDSDDSEEEDDEGQLSPSKKKRREDNRSWKLENYLDHDHGKLAGANSGPLRLSRSPRRGGRMDWRMKNLHLSHSSTSTRTTLRTQPHPRDDDFVGRDGDLANMYRILSTPGRLCSICGTGGIGKTATAIEYDHRYENSYSYIFWIQSETQVGCADTFSLIAIALGLAPDGEDQKLLIELGREFLEKTEKKWLLIFDNVDKWADIEQYIPINMPKTQGSILITTRFVELEPTPITTNYFRLILKEMTVEENQSLLIQRLQPNLKHEKVRFHKEWKTAGAIASLAGLPLAISHIAGYVRASGCTLAEFLELWNEWSKNGLSNRPTDATSNAALETVWDMALPELGSDALKLLKILAFVDSDGIQKELLMNAHGIPGLAFLNSSNPVRFRKMMSQLTERKLVTAREQNGRDVYSVHRLLQHRLLQDLDEDPKEREEAFVLAFELIRERLPRPSMGVHDATKWNDFKEYLPHVLTLQRIYDDGVPKIAPFVRLANLFRDGGVHLWQRGMIYDGLRLLKSAESILDLLECDEDQMRIDIHIATALLIQYFGISHREESRFRFQKILELRKKIAWESTHSEIPTKEHGLLVCNALADYGNSLLQFNNYKDAEPIYQDCHAKYQVWGTEDEIPFEYAKFSHHMAFCRMYHRDFIGAIQLGEKAVELVARQGGSPQLTWRFRFDLACIILQSGDIHKSLEIQEQILKARLVLQGNGKTNYFTLQSYYAVGALYAHLQMWDEAEINMGTALSKAKERTDKGFWPDAAVARTEFHLSQVMKQKGKDNAEAEGLVTKARSVLSRLLPYDPLEGVSEEDEIALFDHLQPIFGGRFTGLSLLKYIP